MSVRLKVDDEMTVLVLPKDELSILGDLQPKNSMDEYSMYIHCTP